ncbi:hypothetical protein [Prevotella ihumii]|uniref:hypothetical protein n=1 Tax=Prevotella ihumii TaxID=1917878 RepID=UPI000980E9C2|nr:hypothetical protein [Prevotella ihumii]
MDLEEQLKTQYGNQRPFKVDEHYFDNISEQIFARIAEEEKAEAQQPKVTIKPIRRMRPLLVAASVVGLIACATITLNLINGKDNTAQGNKIAKQQKAKKELLQKEKQQEIEDAAEYMMIDEDEMYAYLAEN